MSPRELWTWLSRRSQTCTSNAALTDLVLLSLGAHTHLTVNSATAAHSHFLSLHPHPLSITMDDSENDIFILAARTSLLATYALREELQLLAADIEHALGHLSDETVQRRALIALRLRRLAAMIDRAIDLAEAVMEAMGHHIVGDVDNPVPFEGEGEYSQHFKLPLSSILTRLLGLDM